MVGSKIFDHLGRAVALGPLLRRGGEGAVYHVADHPSWVAKLYEKPPALGKAEKLSTMIATGSPALARIAAWPVETLYDRPHGQLLGFMMPKIVGFKEVHKLYGPSHRQREFAIADWAFLVHAAANCAAAFETIHGLHHLMGDVNPNNVLVSDQALISLIDCDSFQVQSNGRTFRCEVGVAEYTPPELQGVVFKDVSRTENHDRFGLAVLIFHLLFMGRHPFAGRYRGPDDMSLERAIKECRFPFSLRRELRKDMEPPPLAPTLEMVTPGIAGLFDRAFADGGKSARPTANEWSMALLALEKQLVACRRDPIHKYASHLAACPWCTFEDGTPPVVFFVSPHGGLEFQCSIAELAPVLAEFERIPGPQTSIPQRAAATALVPTPLPPGTTAVLKRARRAQVACAASGLVVLTGLILLVFMPAGAIVSTIGALGAAGAGIAWSRLMRRSQLGEERTRRQQALRQAHRDQAQWRAQWKTASEDYARRHAETHACIEALRRDFSELKPQFDQNLAALEHSKEAVQRNDYLRNEMIEDAVLKGIGSSVKTALRSEGIESAHDVLTHDLNGIPGVGEKRQETLRAWAYEVAQRFRFDPKKDVPVAERRTLVAKYRHRMGHIKAQLERQVADLRQGSRDVAARIEQAQQGLVAATSQLGQAQIDWVAIE